MSHLTAKVNVSSHNNHNTQICDNATLCSIDSLFTRVSLPLLMRTRSPLFAVQAYKRKRQVKEMFVDIMCKAGGDRRCMLNGPPAAIGPIGRRYENGEMRTPGSESLFLSLLSEDLAPDSSINTAPRPAYGIIQINLPPELSPSTLFH